MTENSAFTKGSSKHQWTDLGRAATCTLWVLRRAEPSWYAASIYRQRGCCVAQLQLEQVYSHIVLTKLVGLCNFHQQPPAILPALQMPDAQVTAFPGGAADRKTQTYVTSCFCWFLPPKETIILDLIMQSRYRLITWVKLARSDCWESKLRSFL